MSTIAKAIPTQGPWKVFQLAPDSDPAERFIIVSADGETEVCGPVDNAADAPVLAAAWEMREALENADLRCTQARLASNISKKANQADFLRGELERIQAVCRAAIHKAEGAQ
jgi:hypothetical protein